MTEERDVQPQKAELPIEVTEFGIVIPESIEQEENAVDEINVIPVVFDKSRFTLYVELLIAFDNVVKSLSVSSPLRTIVEFSVSEVIIDAK